MEERSYIYRILRVALGLAIGAFALCLIAEADVGLFAWDVFSMSLTYHLPITYGQAIQLIGLGVLVTVVLLKEQIGVGTILDMFLVGFYVDIYRGLGVVPHCSSLPGRIMLMVTGLLLVAVSQWVYMGAGLSCGSRDALAVALGRRMPRVPIGVVQGLVQGVILIIGVALGGPVGWGTIGATFGVVPAFQLVFGIVHFEPREVEHESLLATVRHIRQRLSRK